MELMNKDEDSGAGTILAFIAVVVGVFLILFQPLIWVAQRWYHWFFGVILVLGVEISGGTALYNYIEANSMRPTSGEVVALKTKPSKTNLRTSPEMGDNVLTSVSRGTTLKITGEGSGSWLAVYHGGKTVWIHKGTVSMIREKIPAVGPFPEAFGWFKLFSLGYIGFLSLVGFFGWYGPRKEGKKIEREEEARRQRFLSGNLTEEDKRLRARNLAMLERINAEEDAEIERRIRMQEEGLL